MDEIREYETQLAEIRQELAKNSDNAELKELETEIVGLIDELRATLPKFAKGDEVAGKTLVGRIVEVKESKMYLVQPLNSELVAEGDPVMINEESLRLKPLAKPKTAATAPAVSAAPAETAASSKPAPAAHPSSNQPPPDSFEKNKSKWKSFSKKAKPGLAKPSGQVAKEPTKKRSYFTPKSHQKH